MGRVDVPLDDVHAQRRVEYLKVQAAALAREISYGELVKASKEYRAWLRQHQVERRRKTVTVKLEEAA